MNIRQTICLSILLIIISTGIVLATDNITTGNVATTGNIAVTTGTEIPVTVTAVPTQKSPGFTSITILVTMVILYMVKRKK